MNEGTLLRRLHGAAIRVQVPLVLGAVPVVAALYGIAMVPIAVELATDGEGAAAVRAARAAVELVVALLVGCVVLATIAASLLLRGSLRASVERLQEATGAIARGDFSHRIDVRRSDELGRLAIAIDTMAERLERLEQARRRLLACVSHELRTPLTIIQGHAFTLGRHERDAIRRERLELMQAESERLTGLIEDLVDASSLHAGSVRLRVERCDLVAIVDASIERFAEEAGLRGVCLVRRGGTRRVPADVDPARIEQVLANLVANAIRHAWSDTTITVAVGAVRGGGARWITVTNVGSGVDEDVADRIFEPFVQGGDRTGRVGLGLAISHGLAIAHGGTLELTSCGADDGRVEFRLQLPSPARLASSAAQRRSAARPAAVAHVQQSPALQAVEP